MPNNNDSSSDKAYNNIPIVHLVKRRAIPYPYSSSSDNTSSEDNTLTLGLRLSISNAISTIELSSINICNIDSENNRLEISHSISSYITLSDKGIINGFILYHNL